MVDNVLLFFAAYSIMQSNIIIQNSGVVAVFLSVSFFLVSFSNKWSWQCGEDKHSSCTRYEFESLSGRKVN